MKQSPTIAIDVGHSSARAGATSARGKPEFEFNQELARIIETTLRARQVRTHLIGIDGDMNVLTDRTAAASAADAQFFLSVHHDSAQAQYLEAWQWQGKERWHTERFAGFSLFVSRKNPQIAASLACARAIGLALKRSGFRSSDHHAEAIPGESRPWADQDAGVYFFDDLVVLKTAKMPAVLFEAGVIVNRDEELIIQRPETRQRLALALAQGLAECRIASASPQPGSAP